NDKDQGGLSVGQADATVSVREYDGALGLTNTQQAADGFTDTFTVALPDAPTAPVTVFLASSANPVDPANGQHLTFKDSSGNVIPSLTFDSTNYFKPQTVTVGIAKDTVVEGPYHETITLTTDSADPNYAASVGLKTSLVANIADANSPQVVVIQP